MSTAEQIYSTVPRSNYLHFLDAGAPKYKDIMEFLDFSKNDLSKATGVPTSSIRYDARMPQELHDRLVEIATVCELVAEYFNGDIGKTAMWFKVRNPMLGDVSPRDMIKLGRFNKLIKFIYAARQGI